MKGFYYTKYDKRFPVTSDELDNSIFSCSINYVVVQYNKIGATCYTRHKALEPWDFNLDFPNRKSTWSKMILIGYIS